MALYENAHLLFALALLKLCFMQKLVAGADGRDSSVRKKRRVPSSPVKFSDSV